jgi:hypothetical protein
MTKWVILLTLTVVVGTLIIAGNHGSAGARGQPTENFKVFSTPPAFYINLDRDVANRIRTETTMKEIFPKLTRVPGVLHRVGREGCRQAHIAAQKMGIGATKPGEYYVVLEDDAKLNVSPRVASRAIEKATINGADLILLNIQNWYEEVKMAPTNNPSLFRLFGGTGSGLAYMVRHEFGQKLINHWNKHPFEHIDISWQKLWPTHVVLVHRPLLFLHQSGPSTTGDTLWRSSLDRECQDFSWDKVKLIK